MSVNLDLFGVTSRLIVAANKPLCLDSLSVPDSDEGHRGTSPAVQAAPVKIVRPVGVHLDPTPGT
jgi:hypothetical protein